MSDPTPDSVSLPAPEPARPEDSGRWFRPVTTRQAQVPWLSVALLNFVWFAEVYNALLHGIGVTLAARRLTADTRLIVLVSTCSLLFSGTVGPLVNYLTDRIWTRLGRRRPFVVGAYFLSAAGLALIPLANSFPTLVAAVGAHALVHAFASPMEPLYMELVPQPQQGRAQAMRNAYVQIGVLFFFQLVLVEFDRGFPALPGHGAWSHSLTGVHFAFWLGSANLSIAALYLLLGTREIQPAAGVGQSSPRPRLLALLRAFPREVFGNGRWWPAYGLYVTPTLVGGVWGSLQSLMLVDQYGFSLMEMARIGLPVSLAGLAVIGPTLGYFADRGPRFTSAQFIGASLVLTGLAAASLYLQPLPARGVPDFMAAAGFVLPLGLACASLLLAGVRAGAGRRPPEALRVRFIVIALLGQIALAASAWVVMTERRGLQPELTTGLWLGYITCSQALGMVATIMVTPLLFSRIPPSKFGTVSSGFGIAGAIVTYVLGNVGGAWVHYWTAWRRTPATEFSGLWLLQAVMGLVALLLVVRCLRALPGRATDAAAEAPGG